MNNKNNFIIIKMDKKSHKFFITHEEKFRDIFNQLNKQKSVKLLMKNLSQL